MRVAQRLPCFPFNLLRSESLCRKNAARLGEGGLRSTFGGRLATGSDGPNRSIHSDTSLSDRLTWLSAPSSSGDASFPVSNGAPVPL